MRNAVPLADPDAATADLIAPGDDRRRDVLHVVRFGGHPTQTWPSPGAEANVAGAALSVHPKQRCWSRPSAGTSRATHVRY